MADKTKVTFSITLDSDVVKKIDLLSVAQQRDRKKQAEYIIIQAVTKGRAK